MRGYYNIKEVAKLLRIPASTLRYWDEEGLIHIERDQENNYRRFSVEAVMELNMISFYRGLGIPIKELKQMLESGLKVQKHVLEEQRQKLDMEMQKLQHKKQRILKQKSLLEEISRLEKRKPRTGIPAYPQVVSYELESQEHWECTMEEPERFMLVLEGENLQDISYGVGVKYPGEISGETVLWEREEGRRYQEYLLTTQTMDEKKNDIRDYLKGIKEQGSRPGKAAAQFLSSGWEGSMLDYYKLWIPLYPL